ncbi:MAG: hypothetical protein JWP26_48 [Devosia sp.]|nr:hypothetical protein [Devosia sp.]
MSRELQDHAAVVWGPLGELDASALNRLALQIGDGEMAKRLGALAHQVVRGDIDPPTAAVWLGRQRPALGADP